MVGVERLPKSIAALPVLLFEFNIFFAHTAGPLILWDGEVNVSVVAQIVWDVSVGSTGE